MNSYYFVSWDWWSLRRGRVVSYGVRSPEEQNSLLVCATPHLTSQTHLGIYSPGRENHA